MAEVELVIRAERVLIDGEERPASVAINDGVIVAIAAIEAPWDAEAEAVLERAAYLAETGVFPEPVGERPPYPWPLV